MVKCLTLNEILRVQLYRAGTKFMRNTRLYHTSGMDPSSKSNSFRKSVLKRFGTLPKNLMSYAKLSKDDTCFQFQYGLCICMESVIVHLPNLAAL